MFNGWIKLYRKILKSRVWRGSNPFDKVVLITLLILARFKEGSGVFGGDEVLLSSGELIISIDDLVELCGKRMECEGVISSLNKLKELGFLTYEISGDEYYISICNFKNYQEGSHDLGWVMLHRGLLDSFIWRESLPSQKVIFVTFILMANIREREWMWGDEVKVAGPGEFVTSVNSIISACGEGISIQVVRSAIKKFVASKRIRVTSTSRCQKIEVVNFSKYQEGFQGEDLREKCGKGEGKIYRPTGYGQGKRGVFKGAECGQTKREVFKVSDEGQATSSLFKEGCLGQTKGSLFIKKFNNKGITIKEQQNNKGVTTNNKGEKLNKDNKENNTYREYENPENSEVYEYYLKNGFGALSGEIIRVIDKDISSFGMEVVIEAIDCAIRSGKRTFGYVGGILRNWKNRSFGGVYGKFGEDFKEKSLGEIKWVPDYASGGWDIPTCY